MPSKMQTLPVYSLLKTKYIVVRVVGDFLSAKYDINGLKEMHAFLIFEFESEKKHKQKFQNI